MTECCCMCQRYKSFIISTFFCLWHEREIHSFSTRRNGWSLQKCKRFLRASPYDDIYSRRRTRNFLAYLTDDLPIRNYYFETREEKLASPRSWRRSSRRVADASYSAEKIRVREARVKFSLTSRGRNICVSSTEFPIVRNSNKMIKMDFLGRDIQIINDLKWKI